MPNKSLTVHLQDVLEKQAELVGENQRGELNELIGQLATINARAASLKAKILKKRQISQSS